ncbi:hypothetical protein [Romboutsia weinsteinii]|uniref:hypothetical protein n=1 Tax=Romboutsia weinsteinii TaxID=2020949 RepID=UPI002E8DF324|nr:hypothetical protein [Romboutsia weinsteinii]
MIQLTYKCRYYNYNDYIFYGIDLILDLFNMPSELIKDSKEYLIIILIGLGLLKISIFLTVISLGTRVVLAYILSSTSLGERGIWWSILIGWSL